MKGIILHGGHGTRLRPLTHTGPKQLLPIANKPMSEYCLESIIETGIKDIAIIIGGVGSNKVREFYGDGSNLDGVASAGLGTAISETAPGDVIYYTDTVLSIAGTAGSTTGYTSTFTGTVAATTFSGSGITLASGSVINYDDGKVTLTHDGTNHKLTIGGSETNACFAGKGTGLTNLSADNIASGTLDMGRIAASAIGYGKTSGIQSKLANSVINGIVVCTTGTHCDLL